MTAIVPTSIVGEALHAGFGRLRALLQHRYAQSEAEAGHRIAQALDFTSWMELCDAAISTTSRRIDPRLVLLVDAPGDNKLAERLAVTFDTSPLEMGSVLQAAREEGVAQLG